MRIGKTIQEIRKHKGISQMELCEETGITQAQISLIERGLSIPRQQTLNKILNYIQVTEAELLVMCINKNDVSPEHRLLFTSLRDSLFRIINKYEAVEKK